MPVTRREFFKQIAKQNYLKYINLFIPSGMKRVLHLVKENNNTPEQAGLELGRRKSPVLEKLFSSYSSINPTDKIPQTDSPEPDDINPDIND